MSDPDIPSTGHSKSSNLSLWKKLTLGRAEWGAEGDPCKAGVLTSAVNKSGNFNYQNHIIKYFSHIPTSYLLPGTLQALTQPCPITCPCCSNRVKWGFQTGASKMQTPSDRQHAQKEPVCSNYLPCQSRTSQASSFKKIKQAHQLLLLFFVTFYFKITWYSKGCSIVVLNIFPWFYFHHESLWLKISYSLLSGYLSKWKLAKFYLYHLKNKMRGLSKLTDSLKKIRITR